MFAIMSLNFPSFLNGVFLKNRDNFICYRNGYVMDGIRTLDQVSRSHSAVTGLITVVDDVLIKFGRGIVMPFSEFKHE
jgi:hypothetical protein